MRCQINVYDPQFTNQVNVGQRLHVVEPGSRGQQHSISELAQDTANNLSHSHTTESYCANSRKVMPVPFRAIGNEVSHEDNMK